MNSVADAIATIEEVPQSQPSLHINTESSSNQKSIITRIANPAMGMTEEVQQQVLVIDSPLNPLFQFR